MNHHRWRRLLLGVFALACSMLGLLAGSASAVLSMDTSTDTDVTIDSDHHWFVNSMRPMSYGGYQYMAYWDNVDPIDGRIYLKLTRRRLSDGNLVTLRFDTEPYVAYLSGGRQDGHNYVGLGVSPNDGRVHIAWSLHTSDRRMRYWYSNTSCMERTQEEFTAANCRFELRFYMAERTIEERITYPTFINDQRDRLWFTQRFDASARGDQFLNFYDETAHAWTLVGEIIRGRVEGAIRAVENEYSFRVGGTEYRARERGVYIAGIAFDKNDRLHVAWAWRENAGGYGGQHGLNYAYSDDGGRTWYAQSGTRVGTAETDIIGIDDQAQIEAFSVPPGSFLFNSYLALDAYNNPHILGGTSNVSTADLLEANTRLTHYWRNSEGTWYSQYVEGTEEGGPRLIYPSIFLDRGNIVYGLYAKSELAWEPYNASAASYVYNDLPPDNVTWQPDGERDGFLNLQLYSTLTCIDSTDDANASISTAGNNQIRFRMRNDTDEPDVIATWTTHEDPAWEITRQQRFTRVLTARDRSYTEYRMTVTDADWNGTLRSLELCTAEGVSTGSQSIDWIKVTNSGGTAAKTWEFTRGFTLYGVEASPNDNWATWQREELLPGVSIALGDGYWGIDRQRYARDKVVDFTAMVQGSPGTEALSLREFDIGGDDTAMEVRFDTDKVGWTAPNNVEAFRWSNDGGTKGITGTLTGTDSQLLSAANLKIPLGETTGDNVHVRMKNSTAATTAKLYFITDADRTWNETKTITFTIRARSSYSLYDIDMSRVSGWRNNTLYQLRLDPAEDRTTRSGTFNVDRIYIADT